MKFEKAKYQISGFEITESFDSYERLLEIFNFY